MKKLQDLITSLEKAKKEEDKKTNNVTDIVNTVNEIENTNVNY